jgi:hypothetical protein
MDENLVVDRRGAVDSHPDPGLDSGGTADVDLDLASRERLAGVAVPEDAVRLVRLAAFQWSRRLPGAETRARRAARLTGGEEACRAADLKAAGRLDAEIVRELDWERFPLVLPGAATQVVLAAARLAWLRELPWSLRAADLRDAEARHRARLDAALRQQSWLRFELAQAERRRPEVLPLPLGAERPELRLAAWPDEPACPWAHSWRLRRRLLRPRGPRNACGRARHGRRQSSWSASSFR